MTTELQKIAQTPGAKSDQQWHCYFAEASKAKVAMLKAASGCSAISSS